MAQQNVEFNIGANVTGMEAIATLINRVGALEAETKRLASANAGLAASTETVIRNGVRYNNALDAQSKQLRQSRQGVQQLGMQFNDFATSVSTGASPLQAFNQQIGQVGYAMSMMGGTAGKIGAFLAGPWGAAILMGTMALGPLIAKLFESKDAAEQAANAHYKYLDAVAAGNNADLIKGEMDLVRLQEKRLKLQLQLDRTPLPSNSGRFGGGMGERTMLQKQLSQLDADIRWQQDAVNRGNAAREKLAKAQTTVARTAGGGGSARSSGGRAGALSAIEAAAKKERDIADALTQHKIRAEIQWQTTWDDLQQKHEIKMMDRSSAIQEQLQVQAEMNRTLFIEPVNAGLKELAQSYANIGNSVAGAFKGMLTGATSWKDGMKGIINSVIDELWRLYVVQQIVGLVGNVLGGLTGVKINAADTFSAIDMAANIAGKRANGGHVSGNRPYLVGENGPELMVPGGSGTIIPNRNLGMGGTGGSGMTINVDARGANDPAAVRAQVQQGILEAAPAIIAAAEARTVQGMRRPRLGGAMQ